MSDDKSGVWKVGGANIDGKHRVNGDRRENGKGINYVKNALIDRMMRVKA